MPIRMVDDENDQSNNDSGDVNSSSSSGGNGGGGLFQFIPLIIGLLFRKPILLLVVIVIGGFIYFTSGTKGFSSLQNVAQLATGGILDPKHFDKAEVYEGLDESKNDLPEAISLLKFAPTRLNQGHQGSCVAWSSAYGARTILQSVSTGEDPNKVAFSPSFLYNQIGLDGCQGSYIIGAMENMTDIGAVPFNAFPYDENDCSRKPDGALKESAQQFKMKGFNRLTDGESIRNLNLHAIKEHLAHDAPVVIGMLVGGSFMQDMMGKEIWEPTSDDYSLMGFGGHALCIIGYDDRKAGGAFQIMNSWGPEWGRDGVAWVKYNDFKRFAREAYGLNPLTKTGAAVVTQLSCSIGLVDAKTKQYFPIQLTNDNIFETTTPIAKGTGFKIEVKNNTDCYVYVLGKETDGSSYVLFPYPLKEEPTKTKFSPYCGITGYRLFPKGMKLVADSIGNKDYMAVVMSKEPLNVFELNKRVNDNRQLGFENAVNKAVRSNSVAGVKFSSDGKIMSFDTAIEGKNAVACVVAIDKR
jgi:hypothetical protein